MTTTNLSDRMYRSYTEISKGDNVSFAQNVTYGDTEANDSFGRLRVSSSESIFDNFEITGKKTTLWSENSAGTVACTHVANQSCIQFAPSMTSGNFITRSSKKLSLYTPGTSLMILCTGVMGVGAVNSSQRIGLFSALDGIFFEQTDKLMGVVIRTSTSGTASNNRIEQADWNHDRMDGTGPSGVTLDFTKTQIFFIDLEWLGVGRVRMGFVHEGRIISCHEFHHNNVLDKVYMSTPLLPITYEVKNNAAVATNLTDFRQICCSVNREGGESTTIKYRSVNNGTTFKATTATTAIPILSLRLQTGLVGRAMVKPKFISVLSQGSKDHLFEVLFNATLDGASFANISGICQADTTATAVTGGTKLSTVYSSSDVRMAPEIFNRNLWLGGEITGTADTLTIIARSISGTTTGTVGCGIDFEEHY